MKDPRKITPRDVYRSRFIGSSLGDAQLEMFLQCIVVTQFKINPDAWTPFTWEEYVARCTHKPIAAERELFEAMTTGGKVALCDIPPVGKIHQLESGYFTKIGDCFAVTEKLLTVMAKAA